MTIARPRNIGRGGWKKREP